MGKKKGCGTPRRRKRRIEFFVCFQGELKSIGDGYRGVAVTKTGRKWVHLYVPGSDANARILKTTWDRIPKRVVKRGRLTGEVV